MTTYTKRDLRAVGLLALLLFCIGAILVMVALLRMLAGSRDVLLPSTGAVTTLALATALKLKIRQLVRNRESEEPAPREDLFE